jgi:hypothetical protein
MFNLPVKSVLVLLTSSLLITSVAFAQQVVKFADMKLLSQATTSQLVFDESINLAANFGINQNDSGLQSLFDPATGKSPLCAPSNLAMYIAYQMGITHRLPVTTHVPGVSADLQSIDLNALVTDLAKNQCFTTAQETSTQNFMKCLGSAFEKYFGVSVTVDRISANDANTSYPSFIRRNNKVPDLADIRASLKKGEPVIASLGWYAYNPQTKNWVRSGGHEVQIYGYSWESYFNDDLLELAIMNPLTPWPTSTTNADNDLTMAAKNYYSDQTYSVFLDANHFQGQEKRAFIEALNIIHLPGSN